MGTPTLNDPASIRAKIAELEGTVSTLEGHLKKTNEGFQGYVKGVEEQLKTIQDELNKQANIKHAQVQRVQLDLSEKITRNKGTIDFLRAHLAEIESTPAQTSLPPSDPGLLPEALDFTPPSVKLPTT